MFYWSNIWIELRRDLDLSYIWLLKFFFFFVAVDVSYGSFGEKINIKNLVFYFLASVTSLGHEFGVVLSWLLHFS